MNIVIEAETPGDNRTMFRVSIDQKVVATELTGPAGFCESSGRVLRTNHNIRKSRKKRSRVQTVSARESLSV